MEEYISKEKAIALIEARAEMALGIPKQVFFAAAKMLEKIPAADVRPVVHGEWKLTANEEYANYRWSVTAECSECNYEKGEIYAGFMPGFPKGLARITVLDCAKIVKLDNYCPNCGAVMDGGSNNA